MRDLTAYQKTSILHDWVVKYKTQKEIAKAFRLNPGQVHRLIKDLLLNPAKRSNMVKAEEDKWEALDLVQKTVTKKRNQKK